MSAHIERIAKMGGKTTYIDFRNGFTTCSLKQDSDVDVKAALGMATKKVGALAIMALETRGASTLLHEKALVRAWDAHTKDTQGKRTAHDKSILRFAISLVIRQHTGRKLMTTEVTDLAYLLCVRRETFENILKLASAWLQGLDGAGERAFLEALAVIRPRRQLRRFQTVKPSRPLPQVA